MRLTRRQQDPVDAILDGVLVDEDLTEVALIVHELRSAYLPTDHPGRSPELARLTGASLDDNRDLLTTAASNANGSAVQTAGLPNLRERVGRTRTKMITAVVGFITTVTGKLAVGATVAAASVGGLHAADVVQVPLLPEVDRPAAVDGVELSDDSGDEEVLEAPEASAAASEAETGDETEVDGETADGVGVDGAAVSADARDGGVDGTQVAAEARAGTPAEDRVPERADRGGQPPAPPAPPAASSGGQAGASSVPARPAAGAPTTPPASTPQETPEPARPEAAPPQQPTAPDAPPAASGSAGRP